MQHKLPSTIIGFACLISVIGLSTAQEQPAAPAQQKQMMKGKGMTKDGMMKKGDQAEEKSMMAKHEEMAKLVDQVTTDLAALQKETNLGTLKTRLAADQALLQKVNDSMKQAKDKMKTMMESMMGSTPTPASSAAPATPPEHKH
jgi:CRISPR/Cas system endoribonuclease Cas6 (RAMP superfamily)